MAEFTHPRLGDVVTAIGGSYALTKEVRLVFGKGEVLYLVGWMAVDTGCCGPAGCGYALVPGIVRQWKGTRTDGDRPVSRVEPVRDPGAAAELRRLIREREGPVEVNFL